MKDYMLKQPLKDRKFPDKLIKTVTTNFRRGRKQEDLVGGSGRATTCVFKKLEFDNDEELMSLAV